MYFIDEYFLISTAEYFFILIINPTQLPQKHILLTFKLG